MGAGGGGVLLGDAFGMAVEAFNEVNVVRAFRRGERGIHLFNIEAAIGEARVTGGTGRARMLAMFLMTREATETFVDADGRAVVAGMHFHTGEGRVALVAKRLAGIGADLHRPAGIEHHRQRKKSDGKAGALATVEEAERRAIEFLATGRFDLGIIVVIFFVERLAAAVNGVAREARNDRLVNDGGGQKLPGPLSVEGRDELADATFKEHAVAAETIVHQKTAAVVLLIEKNGFVGDAVRAILPLRGFLLMALLAAADHGIDVQSAQADGIAVSTADVLDQAAGVPQMEAGVEGENLAVASAARNGAVTRGLPGRVLGADFVAPGAGFTGGILVVEASCGDA